MASTVVSMTRSSSSHSSAFSNITVGPNDSTETPDATERASASVDTPATSVSDRASPSSPKDIEESIDGDLTSTSSRPRRARAAKPIYDIKELSRTRSRTTSKAQRERSDLAKFSTTQSRASPTFGEKVNQALDMDWEIPVELPKRDSPTRPQRATSVGERMRKAAGKVSTVLGKRTREVMEVSKRRLRLNREQMDPKKQRILKELDTGKKGVLEEMDLDVEFAAPPPPMPPAKRTKTSHPQMQDIVQVLPTGPLQKTSDGNRVKKWQTEGLYVGQEGDSSQSHNGQKKRSNSSPDESNEPASRPTFVHLPMFNYLDKTRGFTIPYDIYAPSSRRGDEKPKDWKMLNRNRLVGEAKDLWEKEDQLPASACVCRTPGPGELGCEDDCLNRVMQYECNEDNCRLAAGVCSNRPFAELQARKEKGGLYDIGVEVVKTNNRGFGIRACRSFAAGQIIMEYTGEIISEGECQRRMREEYVDKKCYYLMELERNLVIDGTKGSMARFINHSCEPNCEVRMVKVNGTPRMAVFAGELGVMTGEELSYDYNFDNFGENQQACHCGAKTCRGYLGKRLNAAEQKKQAKLAEERKRKAAEEAMKLAAAEERKKKIQNSRGSNWRGWVAVDDADVKAQLRDEKRKKEEAENNTDRARRMAARRGSLSAAQPTPSSPVTRSSRRKTIANVDETRASSSPAKISAQSRPTPSRSKSPVNVSRPQSKRKATSTAVSASITSTSTEAIKDDHADGSPRPAKRSRLSVEHRKEEMQDEEDEEKPIEKPKRKGLLSSVGDVVKNSLSGRTTDSITGKLKQSTLQFARLG